MNASLPHTVGEWTTPSRWWRAIHISILLLAIALVYSNTLENAYHLDSIYRVEDNTEIEHFWPPSRFFTDVRTGSSIPQIAEYRPLMPLSHAINNEIARATGTGQLAGYHVGNILIHAGSAILVYFLAGMLIRHWPGSSAPGTATARVGNLAFIAALLFAVHPVSGSAVNYIAGRDLLLMLFFMLASLLVYFNMRLQGESLRGWALSLVLLSIAILSKQVAILGFGVVFLFEWILCGNRLTDWRLWARTALFGLPTVAYFLLRWLWITRQNPGDTLRLPATIEFPLTMAKAHLFYYLRNFAWPFEMRALADFKLEAGALDVGVVVGIVFIAATLLAAWALRRRKPLITFAILCYWLLFSLEASIFPFQYVVTDYRQYAPLVFLCLVISILCCSTRWRVFNAATAAGLVLYFSASSYLINRHWKTEESFWGQSVKYGADALAHTNYALQIAGQNPQLAEQHYLEALRQNPTHIYASINLGLLYMQEKRTGEGLALLENVVALNPGWALAHYWYSRGLLTAHRTDESLAELRWAADLDPRQLQYQYEAAQALQNSGDRPASIPYLERVMAINPDFANAGFLLGFAYQKSGDNLHAIEEYKRFLARQPEHVQGQFNLAFALMDEGDCAEAIRHFETVLELRPDYREVHLHLARCFQQTGDEAAAEWHRQMYGID